MKGSNLNKVSAQNDTPKNFKNSLSVINENVDQSRLIKTLNNEEKEVSLKTKKKKKKDKQKINFANHFMRLMMINIFVKNLKAKTGIYGKLGKKQLRILNDSSTFYEEILDEEEDDIDQNNIFVKLIVY